MNSLFLQLTARTRAFSGVLWVVSTDFQRNLAKVGTSAKSADGAVAPPKQVEWCGNDAVLVSWEMSVLLVGPFGDTLRYAAGLSISDVLF